MTDWTQVHPTYRLTAPDGREVNIDREMAPLVRELWRLGFETKLACQDAGEAVQGGGTRAAETDVPQASARLKGRAWLVVRREDGPRLLEIWRPVGQPAEWVMRPVCEKDSEPDHWVSITFPRHLIEEAARALTGY